MEKLRVEPIIDLTSFKAIKKNWEQLYKSDPNSHVYISWLWLYGLLSAATFKWVVLGVKNMESSTFVAFLPLKIYDRKFGGISFSRQITYAGNPISAYSGILCEPYIESEAIPYLATFIQSEISWDILHFDWIKDPRLSNFLSAFSNSNYDIDISKGLSSPYIELEDDYDIYLSRQVGKKTRQKIRRETRFILESESYKITYSNTSTIYRDIDFLSQLWLKRWQKKQECEWHRNILHHFFENGLLKLSMIWDREVLVSAVACLIDPKDKTYYGYIHTYNPDYSNISPVFILIAENIKQAIAQKFKYFDFGGGLDAYKLSFAQKHYETKNLVIKRKSLKMTVTSIIKKQIKSVQKRLR